MKRPEISKTSRILAAFHLFLNCKEVSYQEFANFSGTGQKTAYRDMQLLARAGVIRYRYSRSAGAFVPLGDRFVPEPFEPPDYPENKRQAMYLDKLIRLCTLMTEMWGTDDPVVWYRQRYPALSARTRQRDFKELWKISYEIRQVPAWDSYDGERCYSYRDISDAYDFYFNK